jgi:hypothetical protein
VLTAFYCKDCGAQLTEPLRLRSGKDPSVEAPDIERGQDFIPKGEVYKSYDPIERSYSGKPAPLEFSPQFWINPLDLTDAVRLTRNRRRLSGCCGIAGTDGLNQLCRCGAEVGTLRNDCWTGHVFIPDPKATTSERLPE